MVCLGTFAPYTVVNQASCVKILDDIPLDKACLVGCGVTTGWGSAVYAADVQPGDNVAVIGIGGIGASAVQGARLAGAEMIFAIDPVAAQARPGPDLRRHPRGALHRGGLRAHSSRRPGATCATRSSAPWASGRGDDGLHPEPDRQARPRRRHQHPSRSTRRTVTMNLMLLTIFEKQVVGSIFGSANIHSDIPKLLKLYRNGLARPRLHDHQHLQARRHQPGLSGHARRQEHPRRPHLRQLSDGPAAAGLRRRAVRGPDVVAALADLFGHHADAHEHARRPCSRGRGRRPTPGRRRAARRPRTTSAAVQ